MFRSTRLNLNQELELVNHFGANQFLAPLNFHLVLEYVSPEGLLKYVPSALFREALPQLRNTLRQIAVNRKAGLPEMLASTTISWEIGRYTRDKSTGPV